MVNQHQRLAVEMHPVWTVKSPLFLAHYILTIKQRAKAPTDTMVKARMDTITKAPVDTMVMVLMDTIIKAPVDTTAKAPTIVMGPIGALVSSTMVLFTVRVPVLVVHTATVPAIVLFHHQQNSTPAMVKGLTPRLEDHTMQRKPVCSR